MKKIIAMIVAFIMPTLVFAGAPLFLFTPLTATTIQIAPDSTATIQYTVQNQSTKPHRLTMIPIPGITQIVSAGHCAKSFLLGTKQSCTLTLQVAGSTVKNVHGGPIVCQEKTNGAPDPLLCYQPGAANVLNITTVPLPKFIITPSAGPNGTIDPSTPQTVTRGTSLLFSGVPKTNFVTYQWFVDDALAQTGGISFLFSNITENHTVRVTFIDLGTFYSGGQNGNVYYSLGNGGATWTVTPVAPAGGSPVNSVFATADFLYAGAADGFIYYTANTGSSWNSTTSPDGSAVNSVFVQANTLYAGTANGGVFQSSDNGSSWIPSSQPDGSAVNTVFAITGALYAGTANGNVYYSVDNGSTWTAINGQPDGSAVKNVFVSNNKLVVNTTNQYVYSSTALTGGGTWETIAQSAYSLFAYDKHNGLYSGTESGFVFLASDGIQLGFITYTLINSVFILN